MLGKGEGEGSHMSAADQEGGGEDASTSSMGGSKEKSNQGECTYGLLTAVLVVERLVV